MHLADRDSPNESPTGRGRRALVIINPGSRSGGQEREAAFAELKRRGISLLPVYPDGPQQIGQAIRGRRQEVDAVIVGGGDGTLNAAAAALYETGLPLGILPLGTANDLARTLGIPITLSEACAVIADGHVRSIDLGVVNDVHFFNVATIGLGARVTQDLEGKSKKRWGMLAFLPSLIAAWRHNRPFGVEVLWDGQRARWRSLQVAVGNGRHHGGGIAVAEDAAIDDGELFFYSVEPRSLWRLAALAPRFLRGRHREPVVHSGRGQTIMVKTATAMPIDTDGELMTRTPARFRVLPSAIRVYAPRPSGPDVDVT